MINIDVWTHTYVEVELEKHEIHSREDMINLIKAILNKAYYSGERLCLESVDVNTRDGKAEYTEIERWS